MQKKSLTQQLLVVLAVTLIGIPGVGGCVKWWLFLWEQLISTGLLYPWLPLVVTVLVLPMLYWEAWTERKRGDLIPGPSNVPWNK